VSTIKVTWMYISIIYKITLFRTWPSNEAEIKAEEFLLGNIQT